MNQVRPLPTRSLREHAKRRLVDLSSSNPIRWRPCADPVQKRDPGEWTTQKGLTDRGPLQKARYRRAGWSPTGSFQRIYIRLATENATAACATRGPLSPRMSINKSEF